jgi:hypothetical protein
LTKVELATTSQLDFLGILHEERGLDFDRDAYAAVSKQEASDDITALMRSVGSNKPASEEQLAEIAEIREYLGPRDEDTVPTDYVGAVRLLKGLRRAQWARRQSEAVARFEAKGATIVSAVADVTATEQPPIEVSEEDIPF